MESYPGKYEVSFDTICITLGDLKEGYHGFHIINGLYLENSPNKFNMRIIAQLTPNRSPTSEPFSDCDRARRRKPIPCHLCGVNRDHFQICANTTIAQSNFLPILILKRPYNLSSYI